MTQICSDLAYNGDGDLLVNPNGLRPPSMVQIGSRPQQPPPAYVISATANGNGHANNRQDESGGPGLGLSFFGQAPFHSP